MVSPISRVKKWKIHRIRLINFHNIQNEIVELNNGGHLFLLGDNGSGKSTILDAVHYVLTAGELVEFNSAARVVGQRAEGRRLQGIIMRFNTETGAINANGGVTYAVLELHDDKDQVLSVGIGMSCRTMEEQLQRWGLVENRRLEDLPLLIEDNQGLRPRGRAELKTALEATNGYYNIGPFRREITQRLFNNPDVFHDVCRLLRMGKAYREIVAQSNDYHELFMRLMPEPKTEIFERVIDSLQSLEESKSVLEEFIRKQRYVTEMQTLTQKIHGFREQQIRLDWVQHNLAINERGKTSLALEKHLGELNNRLKKLENEREALFSDKDQARKHLDDLKTRDREGLVRQEKEIGETFSRKLNQQKEEEGRNKSLRKDYDSRHKHIEKMRDEVRKLLKDAIAQLGRFAPTLPFPINDLLGELDDIHRQETPESHSGSLTVNEPIGQSREEVISLEKELALLNKEAADLHDVISKKEKVIAKAEAGQTVSPSIKNFVDARALLRQSMIGAHPLYEAIEWKAGVTQARRSEVEEIIGVNRLATIMVDTRHYEEARAIIVKHYPNLRITHPEMGHEPLPDWFNATFDLQTSHPDALRCLAAEMHAPHDPEITSVMGQKVLRFRGHERRLATKPARLIGTESRKKALSREIKEEMKHLKELKSRDSVVQKKVTELDQNLQNLKKFISFLEKTQQKYMMQIPQLTQQTLSLDHLAASLGDSQTRVNRLKSDIENLIERRETIQALISKEGLANLEQKVGKANNRVAKLEEALAELDRKKGGLMGEIEGIRTRLASFESEQSTALGELDRISERLLQHTPGVEDVEDYILNTQKGNRFNTEEQIQNARRKCADGEVETRTMLKTKMNDPSLGAAFSFVYDEEKNQLLDRRGRDIQTLVEAQTKTINDQQQVVNEETFLLFKEIIMKELITELRKMVFELEDMSRNINDLLKKRSFGNNRYRFQLKPKAQYKHLISIIHSIDRFDSEPEKELREFFEDHREDIVNTEAGEIPDLLDYRNWFQFEMQVMRVGQDGQVGDKQVMTRRIKGLGSGGEQAVPNYLLVLTIAHFLYKAGKARLSPLLFDEAFYGIDAHRRDQLLGFASDLELQLFVASPDQDGVKREIDFSTTLLIVKDVNYNVHTYKFDWRNPSIPMQTRLFEKNDSKPVAFSEEIEPEL